ncbi:DUF397 domain-containing protein [Actinomadura meridiana]|uniref:DUF397 domain-containing protein n=1 Tax=Actinomadura meridiana TaxID=559626 RepID=UPI0031E63596
MSTAQWRKSSHSGHGGGACVEVAVFSPAIVVRDSKNPGGPVLAVTTTAWRILASQIKVDQHNLSG